MGPLDDENKIQVDKKNNKNEKKLKNFRKTLNQEIYDYSL